MHKGLHDILIPALTGVYNAEAKLFVDDHYDFVFAEFARLMDAIESIAPNEFETLNSIISSLTVPQRQRLILSPDMQWMLYFSNQTTVMDALNTIISHLDRGNLNVIPGTDITMRIDTQNNIVTDYMKVAFLSNPVHAPTDILKAKVTAAFDLIRSTSPSWFEFINDIQSECYLYSHSDPDASFFSSGSFRGLNGAFFIHAADNVTTQSLAEAIVHEAIHTAIYLWEYRFGIILKIEDEDELVISPWTQNTISKDNFAQAIFVWAGLVRFWKAAKISARGCQGHLDKALSGFKSNAISRFIEANKNVMEEGVASAYRLPCVGELIDMKESGC